MTLHARTMKQIVADYKAEQAAERAKTRAQRKAKTATNRNGGK